MTIVNWEHVLQPIECRVSFSSLEIPEERDEIERDVAQIVLENGFIIDITWVPEENEYVTSLYRESFDDPYSQLRCNDPRQVIEHVKELANAAAARSGETQKLDL